MVSSIFASRIQNKRYLDLINTSQNLHFVVPGVRIFDTGLSFSTKSLLESMCITWETKMHLDHCFHTYTANTYSFDRVEQTAGLALLDFSTSSSKRKAVVQTIT